MYFNITKHFKINTKIHLKLVKSCSPTNFKIQINK